MKFWLYLIVSLALLASCQCQDKQKVAVQPDQTTVFTGTKMTIDYKIIVGQQLDAHQIRRVSTLIDAAFQEVDLVYNKWNPKSELSLLNNAKADVDIAISPKLENLLHQTDLIVSLSGGRFDPTIEPLQQLWKTKLETGAVPNAAELAEISPAIGWNKIHFGNGNFKKSHDKTKIDLGGIAKGYCVDLLIERLNQQDYPNVYVEWGGEIRTSGKHPQKRPWTIFISRLGDTDPSRAITTLALEDRAIATSGDYLQNWSVRWSSNEGKPATTTYFHIFDPKTLQPLTSSYTSIASASVAASKCAFADGLATAAMMFPSLAEAEDWAKKIGEQYPDITFWLISREQASKS